jgi:D-alanyl-D-alanine carboxypeptidase
MSLIRFHRWIALLVVVAPVAVDAQSTPLASRVDSIAAAVLTSTGVPSATVAVVQHGRVTYAQAYGTARLEPRSPATAAMRYGMGSVSKEFTAAALLLLQEDGKLRLDDRVERWVPGLTRGRDITLRQLLSHTSGYQDFWPQDYVPPEMTRPVAASAILARWARRPLDFEPGSRWQYSNTNYVIAALAVERASGMPFYRFLRTRILDPLGLVSAVDFDVSGPTSIEPVGYMRYGLGPLRPALSTGAGWMYGAGELAMTARDLAAWDIAMMHHRLLSPASWRELGRTVILTNGVSTRYALGLFVGLTTGHRTLSHDGEVAGFTAQNIVFPDDSAAVVVLTNQDAAPAAGLIANQVARELFTTEDALTTRYTERARRILDGLQHGTVDRSLFTANANAYFSAQALADFAASLAPLGAPTTVVETNRSVRGGMVTRSYAATFAGGRRLHVWTYELPDGTLEQYQVAPMD